MIKVDLQPLSEDRPCPTHERGGEFTCDWGIQQPRRCARTAHFGDH